MIVALTLDEALAQLRPPGGPAPELLLEERSTPAELPVAPHSPYRPGYEWLFLLERRIARVMEPWMKQDPRYACFRDDLLGPGGLFTEGLSNAFCHGHGRDPQIPLELKLWASSQGVLLRLEDEGRGFDHQQVLSRLTAGRTYYQVAGSGFRHMCDHPIFQVFFTDRGTAWHLLARLERP